MFLKVKGCFFDQHINSVYREYDYYDVIINTDYIRSIEPTGVFSKYDEVQEKEEHIEVKDCRAFNSFVNIGKIFDPHIGTGNYSFYSPYTLSEWMDFLAGKTVPDCSKEWPLVSDVH